MAMDDPADVIGIGDQETDVEEIMRRIREDLARRQEGEKEETVAPWPVTGRFSARFYSDLHQVNLSQDKLYVSPYLAEGRRVPLMSRLWRRVRWSLHQLALFYVNALAERQATVNGQLVRVLNQLVHELEKPSEETDIGQLRQEIRALQERVSRLEDKSAK
jgi:hypothetical protein